MSEESAAPTSPQPESQHQRWLKYGANVALSIVVVIALATLLAYLAQRFDRRIDVTASGAYSLKPQTVNVIRDQKQKVKLVSLYAAKTAKQQDNQYAGPVRDLLEEYSRKGRNIEFESIDPNTEPTKADNLVKEAIDKYGGAVGAYRDFVTDFAATRDQLATLAGAEASAIANISKENLGADERGQTLAAIVETMRDAIPQHLSQLKQQIDRAGTAKFPDYQQIVESIRASMQRLSEAQAELIKLAAQAKDDKSAPAALREYLAGASPRLAAIKQLADDSIAKIAALGELKVSGLQQAIKGRDLILVLGENDWRVINFDQVWVTDTSDARAYAEGQKLKPRFAGEQAVTTAILGVSGATKPKVAFVRAGGPPVAQAGMPPFTRGGPLGDVADRLRGYNFEVVEKDASGMWQIQAQMQGQPAAPEPSDEEIAGAVWIIVNMPTDARMGPLSGAMGRKLAEHLQRGGSAMVISLPQADNLAVALDDLGIQLDTAAICVHESPKEDSPRSGDAMEDAQRLPFVFVANEYGDHPLTKPLRSLDSILIGAVPVKTGAAPAGTKLTSLLPIPQNVKSWGEREIEALSSAAPKFDPAIDVPAPLFAGAAAERQDGARLVVLGVLQSFMNQIVNLPDEELYRRGVFAARFPGNGEMFVDAVFWLAKMDTMIAISPAAMDVPRIAPMSDGALTAWRIGVLYGGLPALVVIAGIAMYFARRD